VESDECTISIKESFYIGRWSALRHRLLSFLKSDYGAWGEGRHWL